MWNPKRSDLPQRAGKRIVSWKRSYDLYRKTGINFYYYPYKKIELVKTILNKGEKVTSAGVSWRKSNINSREKTG
ncbi:hypothetical protein C9I92_02495 [Photobacterium ganghwense]|uniref:Uncharacterized protein n=1 Tax=Photobacterium ganghwense TaxID=320778 RepID=A0A0J1HGT9_9GAMM|nr:hypothetical protein [Photobacterium sp. GSS17]KLV10824.1 hypothetical protein ABT57_05115 [Photobacterium ganghwense]PSU11000.1 hypothetical protein C9I92_02495 [Photobacterium ganghwense]